MEFKTEKVGAIVTQKPKEFASQSLLHEKTISVFEDQNGLSRTATDVVEETAVLDKSADKQAKNKKRKKIITGIAIGAALALTAGLLIADIRRPNSVVKNLFKRTKLGNDIKEGLDFAREAHDVPMENLAKNEGSFIQRLFDRIKTNGKSSAEKIVEDETFISEVFGYTKEHVKDNAKILEELQNAQNASETMQKAIELSGTGTTKIAQVISGNPGTMETIERISPNLATAMRNTTTGCSFSRTLEEAGQFVEEAFKGKGYVLEKEIGAGTIGATYLAKAPDGSNVIIKIIKKGVSKESLQAEEKMAGKFIEKFGSSQEEIAELKKTISGLYTDWTQELDLFGSMKNCEKLANGAERFSVAKVLEVSKNGQCIVMESAKGIQAKDLIEILKDYKMNPAEFQTKYSALISANPWLGDPEKVIRELPNSLLRSFDEQFFFLKKGGQGMMHGDPHTGNFFITVNEKGKLIPEYIDTDNCVIRSAKQIRDDISFVSNYCVGNSRKVAEYFINQCECGTRDKKALIEAVSADIKALIFDRKCNLNNANVMLENIKTILKRHGLKMSTDNATMMKAMLQNLSNVWEVSALSGKHLDILTIMKDIPKALLCMIKAHVNPISCVADALKFATQNVRTSVGSAYQFLIRDAGKVI